MADLASIIEQYISLRDRKDALNRKHKERIASIDNVLGQFESFIMKQMQLLNTESVSTKAGTAYRTTTTRANVKDWGGFIDFVVKNKAFEMLERRASKEAVVGFMEAQGHLPPGIDLYRENKVNIRRSK